jgi:hypothetical protein
VGGAAGSEVAVGRGWWWRRRFYGSGFLGVGLGFWVPMVGNDYRT